MCVVIVFDGNEGRVVAKTSNNYVVRRSKKIGTKLVITYVCHKVGALYWKATWMKNKATKNTGKRGSKHCGYSVGFTMEGALDENIKGLLNLEAFLGLVKLCIHLQHTSHDPTTINELVDLLLLSHIRNEKQPFPFHLQKIFVFVAYK